jgi:hypothetical protein
MKVFTLTEANGLIPSLRPRLLRLQALHALVQRRRRAAQKAAEAAPRGGGMAHGGTYISRLLEFSNIVEEIDAQGVQIKDVSRGLIDFPAWRESRIVLLCWQLDEGDEIGWWHEVEAGFAGRRPL